MVTVANTPTAFEQQLLEYINRSRLDPQGEFDALIADAQAGIAVQDNITSALTYFDVDLELFRTQLDAFSPVAPLAWNGALASAADGHSQLMIDTETQAHVLPGEASVGGRITAAGYSWSTYRENIFAFTKDPLYGHAAFFIDWGGSGPGGMQDPAGHRISILSDTVTEVGISAIAAPEESSVGPWSVTQDFGNRRDYLPQLLGVVIEDLDDDRFYDMGEGLEGIAITASGAMGVYTTTSWASGGYQMALPEGRYEVTFTGEGIDGVLSYELTMGARNVKLDGISSEAVTVPSVVRGDGSDERLLGTAGYDQALIGNGGADVLTGSDGDNVLLGDGMDAVALPELAGQVYRLYLATLDREPNPAGHDNWTERLATGEKSLPEVVSGFVNSPEFKATYGALDDAGFVTLLYRNVLDRDPDTGGLESWVQRLEDGMSREQVVLGFSQSPEFTTSTAAGARSFARAHSEAAWGDDVFRLYRAALDRDPDMQGFDNWSARLADDTPYFEVASGFVRSPEFRATYGELDNAGFVTLLYRNVLGREPDAQGLGNWTARLDDGMTRAEVVRGLAQSPEFTAGSAPGFEAWMRGLGTDDLLDGGAGDNLLVGGAHADVFVFAPGGRTTVADFEPWDTLRLEGFGFSLPEEARVNFEQEGQDLVLRQGDTELTLLDMDLSDLTGARLELA
ncbi:DUF4214 domain-containing protein [Salipiger abyssi]|uniref:DUF4214 domain-containing protein n=1 Tax=Salipiger abyssi TaxID=1250539 RepID=UPI001A90B35A|nr:DUF4214 domain-containing protein [Salipiger abyssi]MBN9889816.1 DUF4214 domain-containing protein [Salipiger abyssi]